MSDLDIQLKYKNKNGGYDQLYPRTKGHLIQMDDGRNAEQMLDELNTNYETLIAETTDKDIISAPEIIASHVDSKGVTHPNLKARLDNFEFSTTAQLQHKADLADLPSSAYTFKGSTTFAALPTTGNTLGDVRYTTDNLVNYAWTGTAWTPIGNGAFANGSVTTAKLANRAVTPKNTSFVSTFYGINVSKESEAVLIENNYALKMPVHLESSKSYRVGKNAGGLSNVSLKIKNSAGVELISISSYQNLIMEGTAFITDGTFDANEVYYLHCNFVNETTAPTKLTGWCVKETETSLTANDYVPYSETPNMFGKINSFNIHADVPATLTNILYPYKDKKLATYGDSVTAQQEWQGKVMSALGFSTLYNYGLGGSAAYQACREQDLTDRITASDWDLLTVMYGINDWAQDRVVGTVTDTNPTGDFSASFSGSINSMIDKLLTLYPTKRIVFMTPTPASYTAAEFLLQNGSADGLLNSNGNSLQDFSAAVIACCKRKSIPCIDLNGNVGWSPINISTYVKLEGTNYIHPNATGGTRMAEVITGGLRKIK